MHSPAPYYWLVIVTPNATIRRPVLRPRFLPAFRAQLDHLLTTGQTAWIERFDGLVLYPRPKRTTRRRH